MPKMNDLTGQRFGRLTVLHRVEPKSYPIYWVCQCDCGEIKSIRSSNLTQGLTKSCGCLKNENLIGQKFNRLTVVELLPDRDNFRRKIYKCQCECGNYINVRASDLKSGNTKSCGCLNIEKLHERGIDLTGKKFGYLTVLERGEGSREDVLYWKCQCKCGTIVNVPSRNLREGKTISCGCIKSKGEEAIANWLNKNNFIFEKEKCFPNFQYKDTKGYPRFDFYVRLKTPILIEYHGIQHYESLGGWNNIQYWTERQKRDEIKRQWAKENNIPLYEIPYWELDNIEKVLEGIIKDTAAAPDMEEAQEIEKE